MESWEYIKAQKNIKYLVTVVFQARDKESADKAMLGIHESLDSTEGVYFSE